MQFHSFFPLSFLIQVFSYSGKTRFVPLRTSHFPFQAPFSIDSIRPEEIVWKQKRGFADWISFTLSGQSRSACTLQDFPFGKMACMVTRIRQTVQSCVF